MSAAQEAPRLGRGLARTWERLETFAERGRVAATVLFGVALAVYALESIVLPVTVGRDFSTYILNWLQLWHWHALFPVWSLTRTPIAAIAIALPLDIGGGWLATVTLAVLFAASIVSWTAVAGLVSRRAAVATAIVLLLCAPYTILFHEDSSDAVFAGMFALWALLFAWAVVRPSAARLAAAGGGVGVLALVRPGNQVLVAMALVCLLLAAPWRRRVVWTAAFAAAALVPILAWSTLNRLRYDDFTVVRGGSLIFSRAFLHGMFSPANGPASRELMQTVERRLLPLEPYKSYGITPDRFLASHSYRMLIDVYALSDRYWGWNSDYAILKRAGYEAVRHHPLTFSREVVATIGRDLTTSVYATVPDPVPAAFAAPPDTIVVNGKTLPRPTEGEPIPASHESFFVATPHRSIEEVWTSATNHGLVFKDPKAFKRWNDIGLEVNPYADALPPYAGDAGAIRLLNRASRLFPPPIAWVVLGLAALAVRRTRRGLLLVAYVVASLLVLFVSALGIDVVGEYVVPFLPAFVLFGVGGLLGVRRAVA